MLIKIEAIYWRPNGNNGYNKILKEKWINPDFIVAIEPNTEPEEMKPDETPMTFIKMHGRFECYTINGTPEDFAQEVNLQTYNLYKS